MDPYCKKMHLAHRLDNVACTLEGEETSMCWHEASPPSPPSSSSYSDNNGPQHQSRNNLFYHSLLHSQPELTRSHLRRHQQFQQQQQQQQQQLQQQQNHLSRAQPAYDYYDQEPLAMDSEYQLPQNYYSYE